LYGPPPSGVFGWGASMIASPGVKIWPLMMVKFEALAGIIREHNRRMIPFLMIKEVINGALFIEAFKIELRKIR